MKLPSTSDKSCHSCIQYEFPFILNNIFHIIIEGFQIDIVFCLFLVQEVRTQEIAKKGLGKLLKDCAGLRHVWGTVEAPRNSVCPQQPQYIFSVQTHWNSCGQGFIGKQTCTKSCILVLAFICQLYFLSSSIALPVLGTFTDIIHESHWFTPHPHYILNLCIG